MLDGALHEILQKVDGCGYFDKASRVTIEEEADDDDDEVCVCVSGFSPPLSISLMIVLLFPFCGCRILTT